VVDDIILPLLAGTIARPWRRGPDGSWRIEVDISTRLPLG
jgi:hypothetical protein